MKKTFSQSLAPGDILLNLGTVEKVELMEASQLVRIVLKDWQSMTTAVIWYRYNTVLSICAPY